MTTIVSAEEAAAEEPGPPSSRAVSTRDRWLGAALVVAALGADVVGLVAGLLGSNYASSMQVTPLGNIGAFTFAIVTLAVGLILRVRRPEHALGWTFLWLGLLAGVSTLAWGIVVLSLAPGSDAVAGRWFAWLAALVTVPAFTYLLMAVVVRFPSGEPATALERQVLRWAPAPLILVAITGALRPGPLVVFPAFTNPVPVPAGLQAPASVAAALALLAALALPILAVREKLRRYRQASNIERHQLRWFAYAAALTTVGSAIYLVVGLLLAPERTPLREASYTIFIFAACSLPIAVLVAISRYRLYDIDRIIGRTVAYGALTAILAGIYAAGIRMFNALFVAMTGEESEAALVLTTLVLTITFTPMKARLEKLAARRFPAEDPRPGSEQPTAAAGPPAADLDARMEGIARRVAEEVLAARSERPRRRPGN